MKPSRYRRDRVGRSLMVGIAGALGSEGGDDFERPLGIATGEQHFATGRGLDAGMEEDLIGKAG